MRKPRRFEGDQDSITVAVEVVLLVSFVDFSDVFKKAAEYMAKEENQAGALIHVKTDVSANGYQLKLFLMRDTIKPDWRDLNAHNRSVLAGKVADI